MIDCCSVKSKDMKRCKEIRYYALKTTAATSPLIVRYLLLKISFHEWLQNICALKVVEFWHEWSIRSSFFLPSLCARVCVCGADKVADPKMWWIFPAQTHTHTSAASELILKRIMNAGKFVTVLNFNNKGLDRARKQASLEAERAQLCFQRGEQHLRRALTIWMDSVSSPVCSQGLSDCTASAAERGRQVTRKKQQWISDKSKRRQVKHRFKKCSKALGKLRHYIMP